MKISERREDPILILSLEGRLDHDGASAFQSLAVQRIEEGCRSIIVDFGGISFLASMGIRALIIPAQAIGQQGGRLVITGLGPSIKDLFNTAGLYQMFQVYESVEDAKSALL